MTVGVPFHTNMHAFLDLNLVSKVAGIKLLEARKQWGGIV